jgi:hypothetical protein
MIRKKPAFAVPLVVILAALAHAPGAAVAATATQTVTGTTLEVIAITATPVAALSSNFVPGATATATGTLTLTDTNAIWALTVHDAAVAHPGHLTAAVAGCEGSASNLLEPLTVNVTTGVSGVTPGGTVSVSGSPQTVDSSSSKALAADTFVANYSQTIKASETLRAGCVYSLTATYTLQ